MYFVSQNRSSLLHYGVKGMKWGVRRTPEQLGHRNIRKAKVANVEQWGKSPNTNVLYLTGRSGSGKSTTADLITRSQDSVINLDTYFGDFGVDEKVAKRFRDAEFDTYAKSRGFDFSKVDYNKVEKTQAAHDQFYKNVDRFAELLEGYGQDQFSKGRRVVVEGVQIADGLLHPDKSWYSDKPTIVLWANPVSSLARAIMRDKKDWLINVESLEAVRNYIQWQVDTTRGLSEIASVIHAVSGKAYVDELLEKGR